MKGPFYYTARLYWELAWLWPVYKELGGELINPPPGTDTRRVARNMGFKTTDNAYTGGTLILCWQNPVTDQLVRPFLEAEGKVVVLQHAWDDESSLNMKNDYWDRFTKYLVGGKEDYDLMLTKYPAEKIAMTGMPRLDSLYEVKNKTTKSPLNFPYYFVNAPHEMFHSEETYRYYYNELPAELDATPIFKVHPAVWAKEKNNCWEVIDGNLFCYDRWEEDFSYLLMKHSKAVITPLSFLTTEASLLEKPVILTGEVKDADNPIPRVGDIKNTIHNYEFDAGQKDVFDRFLFDGQNTQRVIKEILSL